MKSKLIDEGSYGCAFNPPLACKKTRVKKASRVVGKVMKKRNATVEINISNLLKQIPNYQDYYIVQEEDNCTEKNFNSMREEYESECKIYRKARDRNLIQLIAPYGGQMLHGYPITERFNYTESLKHMLKGVSELEKAGICHYDLHEGNILVDYTGKLRLIDFGSAFTGPMIGDSEIQHHVYSFDPSYPPQPPELSVQNGLNQKYSLSDAIKQTIRQKRIFDKMESLLGVSKEKIESDMMDYWLNQTEYKWDSKWTTFFHQLWPVWDSWAIGVIFLNLLPKALMTQTNSPRAARGMLSESNFTGKFDASIPNEREIKVILRGLLQVNPSLRLTASEALTALSSV